MLGCVFLSFEKMFIRLSYNRMVNILQKTSLKASRDRRSCAVLFLWIFEKRPASMQSKSFSLTSSPGVDFLTYSTSFPVQISFRRLKEIFLIWSLFWLTYSSHFAEKESPTRYSRIFSALGASFLSSSSHLFTLYRSNWLMLDFTCIADTTVLSQ